MSNNNDQPPASGMPSEPPRVLGVLLSQKKKEEGETPHHPQQPPPTGDDSIATLVSMGFTLAAAEVALQKNDSLEAAISWLFENEGVAEMTGDDDDDYELVHDELKMVLIVRMDLGMSPGKVASQSVHAALGSYRLTAMQNPSLLSAWESSGEAAVCLKCKSQTEMDALEAAAISAGLLTYAVHDAGRTEVAEGSKTVLCIGPNQVSRINAITGKLKLY